MMQGTLKPRIVRNREKLPRDIETIDPLRSSLKELFFTRNPRLKGVISDKDRRVENFIKRNEKAGVWIYYPWSRKAVHSLPENLYLELRTNRNRDLITKSEQQKYRKQTVGIAGLSVGSSIVTNLVMTGGPKEMKIADFDRVEISNLNRIRAKLTDIGINKAFVAAREAWEVDPYLKIDIWDKGLTLETLKKFILEPKLNICIDEMDNIPLKIEARLICKKQRIPVLMATDNGDGILLDVERFDLKPNRKIFHGLINESDFNPETILHDRKEWLKAVKKIIGIRYMTKRHRESLKKLGKKLTGVPQLGTAAFIAGAAVALAVRKIATGEKLPSGRYIINLDKLAPSALWK